MLGFIEITPWHWAGFIGCVLFFLALDLGVFHRESHVVKFREALGWSIVWGVLSLLFAGALVLLRGRHEAVEFVTGYLIELSLSMDNVFVIALIFAFFRVPAQYQHRVLFWGILGAVAMRGVFILVGVSVLARFHWVFYLFGAFLVYTGIKMALPKKEEVDVDPDHNVAVRLFRRFFPIAPERDDGRFFARDLGRFAATPLFIVLIVVETTDLMFALDSLPAVLAITKDGFVALTSNIFAILGLRSLYFALSGVMQLFRYLKFGLAVILGFIGVRMLLATWLDISTTVSLGVIGSVLAISVLASVLRPEKPQS